MDPIEEFRGKMERIHQSPEEMINCLRYLYIAQGSHEYGELISSIKNEFKEEIVEILTQYMYIKKLGDSCYCSEEGEKVGMTAFKGEITEKENEILTIMENLPRCVLFYWFLWKIKPSDFVFKKSETPYYNYFKEGIPTRIQPILTLTYVVEPEEMKEEIDEKIWSSLMDLKVIVHFQNYFKNGKLTNKIYVISPELISFIKDYIENKLPNYYKFFKLVQILALYGCSIDQQDYHSESFKKELASRGLTINDLEQIISYLKNLQVTSEFFIDQERPYTVKNWKRYWGIISDFLFKEGEVDKVLANEPSTFNEVKPENLEKTTQLTSNLKKTILKEMEQVQVENKKQLEELMRKGIGFIYNKDSAGKRLHSITCSDVRKIVPNKTGGSVFFIKDFNKLVEKWSKSSLLPKSDLIPKNLLCTHCNPLEGIENPAEKFIIKEEIKEQVVPPAEELEAQPIEKQQAPIAEEIKFDVFFSYDGSDSESFNVPEIAEGLKKQAPYLNVHYFEDPEVAGRFYDFMDENLKKSVIFIPICTEAYSNSDMCITELSTALKGKLIIPIVKNDYKIIPPLIQGNAAIKKENKTVDQAVDAILKKINSYLRKKGLIKDKI